MPPCTAILPADLAKLPPMPAPLASPVPSPHRALREPSPRMATEATFSSGAAPVRDTSRPARAPPLTSEFSVPAASVKFAMAPGFTRKAQASWSPLASMCTPESVMLFMYTSGTTMRSVLVSDTPSRMEIVIGLFDRMESSWEVLS